MDRYEQIVQELISLSAEMTIRAEGETEPTKFIGWMALRDNLIQGVVLATQDTLSDQRFMEICQQGDAEAIRRIGFVEEKSA